MERVMINKDITIAAQPEAVFHALTRPEEIIRFYPVARVESDMREGGSIRYHGEHDGAPFTDHGTIECFDPGRCFQYRYWSDNHGTERTPENHMSIAYEIEADGTGSRLRVTHGNAMAGSYHDIVDAMWDVVLHRLKTYLETGNQH